jgi:exonuclease III
MAARFSGDQKARSRRGKEKYEVSEEETDEDSEEETDEVSEEETDEGSEEETDQSSDEEVANERRKVLKCPSIRISAINVKSLNIATHRKTVECRTLSKLEAITKWNSDIILMSECKLGKKGKKIVKKELADLGYNQMIANSTKNKRGVAIAIRKGFDVDISYLHKDKAENYLLLECKIEETDMLVGVVYGPNKNDNKFFSKLIRRVENINLPTILGGDFNTVIDENLDLENRASFPNYEHSEILRNWLEDGNFCDAYRDKHPGGAAMSFGFRKPHDYGKSRLDFFIISENLFAGVNDVKYKYLDEPDCEFDHAEVRLSLG